MNDNVMIRQLPTGVPGLDALLGGGLPEFSFNLIAGAPGGGKTTLAHQIMFSQAGPDHRAIFFTVLGEPTLKMLRYQQQFSFFDASKVNASIRYVNLSQDLQQGDFDQVLTRIVDEVQAYSPSLVFVDSFRSVMQSGPHDQFAMQRFLQQLGMAMTSWQATTFLIGEYTPSEAASSPIFTVADGIIWMTQNLYRDTMVRKIQVLKMRGQSQRTEQYTFRIHEHGLEIFPRAIAELSGQFHSTAVPGHEKRMAMGVPGLDAMLGGGLPTGYALLVVGPSGAGKTILATEFLAEGVRLGEPGVIAAFEKSPSQLLNKTLYNMVQSGQVGMIDARSLSLSIDETLHNLITRIQHLQAKRVVIDSLSGFVLVLAPEFHEEFRSALYRMIAVLTGMGVTVLMTSELEDRYTDLRFSPFGSAFLADAIIVQRYVVIAGRFERVLSVVKVRGSAHSKDIRLFEITDKGIVLGAQLSEYSGVLSGNPKLDAGLGFAEEERGP
ncbi:putative circadian clock protein, KaiC [Acidithiobacillus ferrivorans SS3]|uniref:non-specific serine/threonine protein kinase n=2 Tax=Acidithiobacillus ferrivorans TaxID=160808 RepID=G0JMS5_9PROT|nr:putative circadian clock protein, KaiC [Acidithiobacillus ferrivorans SS3]MBU2768258.1 AAA family ATPase [Acidithiobacillus ferrivorans]MBU2851483.1 AAA family ATPase [Acidithiobacillus ferrivorans]OFA15259.1 protein kinase [Acidithiobacillus ferrivorans]